MRFEVLTALLVVGACFVQVSVAQPQIIQVQKNIIDNLSNQTKAAIKNLQQIQQNQISKALVTFTNLKEQVEAAAQDAIADAKNQLDEIIAVAQYQIEHIKQIKQIPEKVGVNISECFRTSLKAQFNKFLQDELNCVQKKVDEALRIINEKIEIVTNFTKAVQDLPEKLNACGSGLSSIGCIKNVTVEVAKLKKYILVHITKKILQDTTFVSGIKVRLQTCAITQVGNAGLAAAGIVDDVAKCAAGKM